MRYLLDTHVFVWSLVSPERLSEKSQEILIRSKDVFVSSISLWEISIKYQLGKIDLKGIEPEDLLLKAREMQLDLIPLHGDDAASFHRLTSYHKDPFDRMLVWQTIKNDLVLVSKDGRLKEYMKNGLQLMW